MNICMPNRSLWRRLTMAVVAIAVVAGAAGTASAQTDFVPYFGKNQIRYDNFDWRIYTTDHFEIYYYPEIEPHLERIASYAESAYQHVSSELKHDLAFKVPLILFSTSSEFWQQNVIPGAAQEGVGAFAEPSRTTTNVQGTDVTVRPHDERVVRDSHKCRTCDRKVSVGGSRLTAWTISSSSMRGGCWRSRVRRCEIVGQRRCETWRCSHNGPRCTPPTQRRVRTGTWRARWGTCWCTPAGRARRGCRTSVWARSPWLEAPG